MEYECAALITVPMPVQDSAHPRDLKRSAFGKRVVARIEVPLAKGERNDTRWRTRSVLHFQMREQSLSTTMRDACRASEQISDMTYADTFTNAYNKTNR